MCKSLYASLLLAASLLSASQRLSNFPQAEAVTDIPPPPAVLRQLQQKNREIRTKDGAVWKVAARGITRSTSSADAWEALRSFHGKRWMPCDDVLAIAPDGRNGVWVDTSCGHSHIFFRRISLAQKADYFEKRVADRHWRHALVADSRLREPGDLRSNQLFSNDNDGLWTAMYAAGALFEYKATNSPAALRRAEDSIRAILHLEKITDMPGYPARSWISADEEKPRDGVWYRFGEKGAQFKSDTSSDEIVGHFLIFDLAWEMLPPGQLRDEVRATCGRMMDHILRHDYHLIDRTGKPTTWGKWSPEYFATPGGYPDSALNALELLSFLKVAERVTGDARYHGEFRRAAYGLGYLEIMTKYLERMEELNYSDEELALLSFYPWMRKEQDPALLGPLRNAFEQWWKNIARQKNPLWNTIREICLGRDAKLTAESIRTLQRIPMDLVAWKMENSWRSDLPRVQQPDRHGRAETTVLLAPDERAVMKWNGNPFVLDGGNGGRSEDDGAFFLLPYWMGRYYGLWHEAK